jgi:hypothetical protein
MERAAASDEAAILNGRKIYSDTSKARRKRNGAGQMPGIQNTKYRCSLEHRHRERSLVK